MNLPVLVAAAATATLLGIGGGTTQVGAWYRNLRKPSWNPPDWAFGPAWTVILICAAWAGVLGWNHAPDVAAHRNLLAAYGINAVFFLFWSPLFFTWKRPDWALYEVVFLWSSIAALILVLAPISHRAGWLLAPYIVWVSFAAFLNFTIVRLNYPFRRQPAT